MEREKTERCSEASEDQGKAQPTRGNERREDG